MPNYRQILIAAALSATSAIASALPLHPFSIHIGGGAGYSDWQPIVGKDYGNPSGSAVFSSAPSKAGGFDGVINAGFGMELSQHFSIHADYFYFTHTNVQFKGNVSFLYPQFNHQNPSFKTSAQAGDLAMRFSINVLKHKMLDAYIGAGVGIVHRHDILSNNIRVGGNFSTGLTHAFNDRISTELAINYFTGYDASVATPAVPYMPFLYSATLQLDYHFG